jgi:hypothetical protein
MAVKIKPILAFDLDGVLINKPPFIPKKVLEYLFRGCKKNGLCYRFPSTKTEQLIRQLSHYYLLRPPIAENILFLQKLASQQKFQLYLISSRYSFLHSTTIYWLKKRQIKKLFTKIILNKKNEQPHLFKEKQLKKIKPKAYFEDDSAIAGYLGRKLTQIKVIQVSEKTPINKSFPLFLK